MGTLVQPTYVTTQPSTGKTVKYRPFTSKEEKALLLSLEEGTVLAVANSIKDVVSVCTFEAIDPDNTPYFDIEYIFLQIRSKSIGEIIDLVGSCECGSKTEFSVDIETTKIEPQPDSNNTFKIPDTSYVMSFRYPSIDDFVLTYHTKGASAFESLAKCITSIYNDDELLDWTFKEKVEFIESMTTKQQKDIVEYLKRTPRVKLEAKYRCRGCGKEHEQVLSGFENFFV